MHPSRIHSDAVNAAFKARAKLTGGSRTICRLSFQRPTDRVSESRRHALFSQTRRRVAALLPLRDLEQRSAAERQLTVTSSNAGTPKLNRSV